MSMALNRNLMRLLAGRAIASTCRCLLVVAAMWSAAANAGPVSVSPLRLTLNPAAGIATLTVENTGTTEALVQTEVLAWQQPGGVPLLVPTDDVIAMPPVFKLAPGAKQRLRVGMTRPFDTAREQTFRLMVTEVPTTVAVPGSVAVAVRHSVPVFILPAVAVSANLVLRRTTTGGLEFANTGNRHLRVLRWRLRAGNGALLADAQGPGYLLAGATQPVPLDSASLASGESLMLEAETDTGPLRVPAAR